MDVLSLEDLESLAQEHEGTHVSIYLPVEVAGRETRQNTIRLKNLLRQAESILTDGGMRSTEVSGLFEPAWQLEDDSDFWQDREQGLALLLSPGFFRTIWMPLQFDERLVVSNRFHLRPLIEAFSEDTTFYLLALSMNDVRFYRCSRFSAKELKVKDMPQNLATSLWADDPERQSQFRNQPAGAASGKQGTFGVFHGSGDIIEDETKDRVLRYCQQINHAVTQALARSRAPLVVASVDYVRAIYREANSFRNLLHEGVNGNPENVPGEELAQRAWDVVAPQLADQRRDLIERFETLAAHGQATSRLSEVVTAAEEGRIHVLLQCPGPPVWSVENLGTGDEQHSGDIDLVDEALVKTLVNDGEIRTCEAGELPDGAVVAAILRYPKPVASSEDPGRRKAG